MPTEVTAAAVHDALAVTGEQRLDGAEPVRAALESLGWDGEGTLRLRRYDVQRFLWYTLPRKFIAPLEQKREVAESLAVILEQLGGRAANYAAICRDPRTRELLRAWGADDPAAWEQFHALMADSGLEPPDTDLLSWGQVMGLDEASAREQIVTALEEAIEAGTLTPHARGFARMRSQVVDAALQAPLLGGDGDSRIDAIHAERLGHWLGRDTPRAGSDRRLILAPVAELIESVPPSIDPAEARMAVTPALWLLERGSDGIALTQTGALNRALVREAAERFPGWWDGAIYGPPHQEADLVLLEELHHEVRHLRLLRRTGRRLLITSRGRHMLADPPGLLSALARDLLTGADFRAACAELVVALLLAGYQADWSEPLAEAIQPTINAAGWRSNGEPPDVRAIAWTISDFIRPATACGLIEIQDRSPRSREPLAITRAGRPALVAALRSRALAPRTGPY
jgi:hypothetical protein